MRVCAGCANGNEATAYLDIRYKVEFLEILRKLAREKGTTIILSLHEIDLACKISDKLLCVKGDRLSLFGDPEELLGGTNANRLYDMEKGSYNPIFGSVELSKPEGAPRVFVLGGGGYGIPIYRQLQKWQIPFAAGILFENEIDTQVARDLASAALVAPAFSPIPEAMVEEAFHTMKQIGAVLDTHCPIGPFNACNGRLLELAKDGRGAIMVGSFASSRGEAPCHGGISIPPWQRDAVPRGQAQHQTEAGHHSCTAAGAVSYPGRRRKYLVFRQCSEPEEG